VVGIHTVADGELPHVGAGKAFTRDPVHGFLGQADAFGRDRQCVVVDAEVERARSPLGRIGSHTQRWPDRWRSIPQLTDPAALASRISCGRRAAPAESRVCPRTAALASPGPP
jgi:hypothetical protein